MKRETAVDISISDKNIVAFSEEYPVVNNDQATNSAYNLCE